MLLEVEGLKITYGGVTAVDGIDFTVDNGEVVAMIGANGAGKSSTLMALSGVVGSNGSIKFNSVNITNLSAADRVQAGIVQAPEGRRIFSRLTVKENLILGAYLKHDKRQLQNDLDQMVELFPILGERMNQSGGTLSGGEQQMLAIARGLMAHPKLLLLDEPSLGLSPIFAKLIFSVIQKLSSEGSSILLVEQNARAALKISSRGYCLENGRIFLSGSSIELQNNPMVQAAYLGG